MAQWHRESIRSDISRCESCTGLEPLTTDDMAQRSRGTSDEDLQKRLQSPCDGHRTTGIQEDDDGWPTPIRDEDPCPLASAYMGAVESFVTAELERRELARDRARRERIADYLDRVIPGRYHGLQLQVDRHNRHAVEAVRAHLLEGGPGVYLHGPTGTGKTSTVLEAIRRRAHMDRCDVAYIPSARDYLKRAWRAFDITDRDERRRVEDRLHRFQRAPFMVLDDITTEETKASMRDTLGDLLDVRWREGLPLMVISNHPLDVISRPKVWGERIGSRIAGMTMAVELNGPDRRRHDP